MIYLFVLGLELSTTSQTSEISFKQESFLAFQSKANSWGHILLDFVFAATISK